MVIPEVRWIEYQIKVHNPEAEILLDQLDDVASELARQRLVIVEAKFNRDELRRQMQLERDHVMLKTAGGNAETRKASVNVALNGNATFRRQQAALTQAERDVALGEAEMERLIDQRSILKRAIDAITPSHADEPGLTPASVAADGFEDEAE